MNATRSVGLAGLALFVCATFARTAAADLPEPSYGFFGIDSFVVSPPSGVADDDDLLTIAMHGVAGTSLTPEDISVTLVNPTSVLVRLSNPYDYGATVLTTWSRQAMLGTLAAGTYDFWLAAATGSGSTTTTYGPALVLEDFVVSASDELPGDYNEDGMVDAADYTVWRNHFGAAMSLPNETATPGMVTSDDYDVWKQNVGATTGGGSHSPTAVLEPSSLCVLLCGLLVSGARRAFAH
jgi:hypothetical protein